MQGNKLLFLFSQLEFLGADVKKVIKRSRKREHAQFRNMLAVTLRNWGYSLNEVAAILDNRNHTSIMNMEKSHETEMKYEPYREKWEHLQERLAIRIILPPNYTYKGNQLTNVNITHDL